MNAWEEGDEDLRRRDGVSGRAAVPRRRRHAPPNALGPPGALDVRPRRRLQHHQARAARRPGGRIPALRRAPRRARLSPRLVRGNTARGAGTRASTPSPTSTSPPASARTMCCRPATRRASRCSCRARPDAAEGDGWLVALVYRGAEDRSDFVVFDAQDVAAGPIATRQASRAACRLASTATGGGLGSSRSRLPLDGTGLGDGVDASCAEDELNRPRTDDRGTPYSARATPHPQPPPH